MAATTTTWPLRRLKDITSKIGSGATPRGGKNGYRAEGISLIRSLNVYDFSFTEEDLAFIGDEQAAELDNVIVQKDDILLNITGASVARCCLTNPKFLPARVNQHVAIVRVRPDVADARFVLYCINSLHFKSRLLALAQGGATREALTKTTIEDFEVCQPPLAVQRRRAGILSAYDELMENSQRRIRLLEAMARALYREWFVHFRFPGHEKLPRVASSLGNIPVGWEVKNLGDVAQVNRAQINARNAPDELHYIDISSVSPGQIDSITTYAFANAPGRARRIVQHGDVIWSCVRPNRRSHAQVMHPEPDTIASTGFAVLTATKVPFTFLYFATTTDDFVAYLTNNATGAAYPAVSGATFENANLLIPSAPLLKKFGDATIPMAEQIHALQRQIQNLRRTRNLLLPRLLAGQVVLRE
jgi:type I restriction enzyme S subunit